MFKSALKYILIVIIPFSLWLNFFIADKAIVSINYKVWIKVSSIFIIADLIIIKLANMILQKYFFYKKTPLFRYQNIVQYSFLLGNILFIYPYYYSLWYVIPAFKALLIFALGLLFLNIKSKDNKKLSLYVQLFTVKNNKNDNKNIIKVLITLLIYIPITIATYYIIIHSYNPYRESLKDAFGCGYKIDFK